ncbi:hypothetical protein SDC9_170332 [bioreactor metagenome]|uniref:Oxidoreductase YjmC n=1 Tax=bioreactor metagenome TaxID=1076179 RepID=A0A645G7R2_9ZZZZ
MSGPSNTGHMFCAINISHFMDEDLFKNNIDLIIDRIKNLTPIGDNKVYMPGEIESDLDDSRKKNGIPVDYNIINQLNELAVRYKTQKL